jgi:retinol dehydrogenase 12
MNPGNLWTELDRNSSPMFLVIRKMSTFPSIYGAYTELFAGLSPEVTLERSGDWSMQALFLQPSIQERHADPSQVVPWGRFLPIRKDLLQGSKPESEGGTGVAQKFWEWSEAQVKPYL